VLLRQLDARAHYTGLVFTQKYHTTYVPSPLQDKAGYYLTNTVLHKTAFGQEKSVTTKVHTMLKQHVCTMRKTGADQTDLATASAVSGVTGEFTIVAANAAFGGKAEVGDKIAGTNVGASAKITAISVGATNTTFTVDVANSGTVGTNTLTVTPVTRVFSTIVCGQQAMAQAVAEEPHVVIGPVVDKLMRHRPMGWYGVLGFARYREEALYRIETGSSIAAL
jgi:hypothetical protein